ncbi:MAG: PKD domain-containing protein, partial [Bacteroidia bacterium]|nr:PKD domain-containing protein [Bacteroidia bacterium]
LFLCFVFAVGMIQFQSCKKEETADPPKAAIFYSIDGKQAAFTALTKRVVTWNWDFGDGKTSTDKDPVHVYADGGYYKVTLIGTDASGVTAAAEANLAVALTPYVLLTGGPTAVNGKTWKLSGAHSSKDAFANADATFSVVAALSTGILGDAGIGLGWVYDDQYSFKFDGSYIHAPKHGGSFAGLVNTMIKGKTILKATETSQQYGLCYAAYTPEAGATFTYVEKEDFTVPSVYGPPNYLVTYAGVSTLDFSGTEFIGFMDNQRKVIVQEITDNTMRIVMFMAASADYFPFNTHALILTFEVVK